MKTTFKPNPAPVAKQPEPAFPYLARGTMTGVVVLVTGLGRSENSRAGTTVLPSDSHEVGFTISTWAAETLIPLKPGEQVILEND